MYNCNFWGLHNISYEKNEQKEIKGKPKLIRVKEGEQMWKEEN